MRWTAVVLTVAAVFVGVVTARAQETVDETVDLVVIRATYDRAIDEAAKLDSAAARIAAYEAIAADEGFTEYQRFLAYREAGYQKAAVAGFPHNSIGSIARCIEYLDEKAPDTAWKSYFMGYQYDALGETAEALAKFADAADRLDGGWRMHALKKVGDYKREAGDANGARAAYAGAMLESGNEGLEFYSMCWQGVEACSGDLTNTAYYNLCRSILARIPPPQRSVEDFAPLIARVEYRLSTLE